MQVKYACTTCDTWAILAQRYGGWLLDDRVEQSVALTIGPDLVLGLNFTWGILCYFHVLSSIGIRGALSNTKVATQALLFACLSRTLSSRNSHTAIVWCLHFFLESLKLRRACSCFSLPFGLQDPRSSKIQHEPGGRYSFFLLRSTSKYSREASMLAYIWKFLEI